VIVFLNLNLQLKAKLDFYIEERSPTRNKSLLIQKKPFAKDKPPLPDIEKRSIKEDKVREEQEVKDVEIQDSRGEEFDKDRLLKQKLLDE